MWELKNKALILLVNPECDPQGCLLKQECDIAEFVWELKRGFEKAAVSTVVCLRECPLRKPPGHCIKESKLQGRVVQSWVKTTQG